MSGATALWLAALVAGMLSATGAMGGADAPSRWPQSMAQAAAKGLSASVTVYGMARDGRSYCDVRAADDEKPLQDEAGPPDPLEAPVRVGSGTPNERPGRQWG